MSLLGDLALQQCPVGWFSCLRKSHYQPYGQRHRSGISIFVILPLGRFFANHHCLETRSRTEAPRKLLSVRCLVVKIWHHPPRSHPASAFRCKRGQGTSQIAQQWNFPLVLLQGPRFLFLNWPTTLLHTQFLSKGQCRNSLPIVGTLCHVVVWALRTHFIICNSYLHFGPVSAKHTIRDLQLIAYNVVGWSFNRQQFTLFCETPGAAGSGSVLDRKNVNFQKRLSPIRQLFMCLASFAVGMRMLGIDKELFVKSMKWS